MDCSICNHPSRATAHFCSQCSAPLALQNKYRITRLLGRGGFGAVYLAEHLQLAGVHYAIKEMTPALGATPAERQAAEDQFRLEASLLAKLTHPMLPKVWDYFSENNRYYLVMEYVEGDTLEDCLGKAKAPLPEAQVLKWANDLCEVLEYLHSQQPPVIHRDVNPRNIKITPEGKLKLIDFGIAKLLMAGMSTGSAARAVSPPYSPMEQYGAGTTPCSDIYALGATMYHLLTNQLPPDAPDRAMQDMRPLRKYNSGLSESTEHVVLKAMAEKATDRFQSATEMKAALPRPKAGGFTFNRSFMALSTQVYSKIAPWINRARNSSASWLRRARSKGASWVYYLRDVSLSLLKRIHGDSALLLGKLRGVKVPLWVVGVVMITLIVVVIAVFRFVESDRTIHDLQSAIQTRETTIEQANKTVAAQRTGIANAQGTVDAQATNIARAQGTATTQLTEIARAQGTIKAQASMIAEDQRVATAQAVTILGIQATLRASEPKMVEVLAGSDWQSSGIPVREGQRVTITYVSGKWSVCSAAGCSVDASGILDSGLYYPDNSITGCLHGALIARIRGNRTDAICVSRGISFQANDTGFLELRVNDKVLTDDSGSITVHIEVR